MPDRLSTAILRTLGIPIVDRDSFTSELSPLRRLIESIYFLPIDWRKLLLDACRIQAPIFENQFLMSAFHKLVQKEVLVENPHTGSALYFEAAYLCRLFDPISYYPPLCSLLSYFVRAEQTYWIEDFRKEKTLSFEKEFKASQVPPGPDQVLDYRSLYIRDVVTNLHPQLGTEVPARLVSLFRTGIRQMIHEFSTVTAPILLPQFNSRKNVSYETQRRYMKCIDPDSEDPYDGPWNITSLDLLKLFYKTGHKVTGPLEMRLAWFFNDLKPRLYYCLGGSAFWDGLYIQPIANAIARFLPSTNPFTSFSVSRLGEVHHHEVLITYDYSSFTTSLDELKYFMFWLAEAFRGVVVTILDVRFGLVDVDLGQLLHDYNESVNVHQQFTTERLFRRDENTLFFQGRGGSLGTKGNIVFSKVNHGVSTGSISGRPDDESIVGDDALTIILSTFVPLFISCVNNLGDIHPSKFAILRRPDGSSLPAKFKYLKRPIYVSHLGEIVTGTLDFFPSVADALFPQGDGIHTTSGDANVESIVKTFVMQWGRFLRLQDPTLKELARPEDLEFLLGAVQTVYDKYGIPREGAIPGSWNLYLPLSNSHVSFEYFVPPCETADVFYTHWLELLLMNFYGHHFSEPLYLTGSIIPPIDVENGQTFYASSDIPELSLMEGLGCLEKEISTVDVEFDDESCERLLQRMSDGYEPMPMMCRFTVVDKPFWYMDLLLHYQEALTNRDVYEEADRLTSIFGSSEI